MALRTSVGTGDWSAAGTWDTGVPVNGDTFAIAAGHTVTFDVDQSGFAAGMGASSIAATGTLVASTAAGSYYLKMNGDLTLNGTLQAGTSVAVPYPSTCTFTIDFNSGSNSIVVDDTTGSLLLYCNEPTYKYVYLTAQEPVAETVIAVDTDVTGDTWAVGDTVVICDLIVPGTTTRDNEERVIAAGGIASGTITLTAGLTAQKEIGTALALVTRNIRLINSTDYIVKNGKSCYIAAEIYNCAEGGISYTDDSTIGGSILIPSGVAKYCIHGCASMTIDSMLSVVGTTAGTRGISACYSVTTSSGSLIAGFLYGSHASINCIYNGDIRACDVGVNNPYASGINSEIVGCGTGVQNAQNCSISGDIGNVTKAISLGTDIIVSNCELGKSVGGVTSTYSIYDVLQVSCYNVTFSATTEYGRYNLYVVRGVSSYSESFDHDGVTNAFKAWCLGGIVSSQTASPPTGHTIWYELAAEDTTQESPVFRQYETTVLPGTAIEVEGKIRIADGEDLSASGLEPQLQIVDKFADPFVDSTQNPLDYDMPADVTGAETDWQDVAVIWANQGEAPRQVIVRMIAYNDGGVDTVYVDGVWSVASYQEDITEILRRVRRLGMTSEY